MCVYTTHVYVILKNKHNRRLTRMCVYTTHVYVILKNKHNSRLEAPRERHQQRSAERETSAEKRRERDISRDVCVRGILNVCVRGSTCMRQVGGDHAPGEVGSIHQFSVGYTLHAVVERITLSHRAYMQFTTKNARLSPSVRSKNVMQLERAPNRGSFKNAFLSGWGPGPHWPLSVC